jgi:hypothetical protein
MWRPLEQFGVGRLLAAVALCALSFTAFRFGFAGEPAEQAMPMIGLGCVAAALAVGVLTMTRPSRILALGVFTLAAWGALIGVGAAIVYFLIESFR